jgi:ATP-dependent helicase/nuclease subunit A
VDLARSVTRSALWHRALASGQCFTELPFELVLDEQAPVPVLLRGQIDLVFREEDGWVVVDYKTDVWRGGDAKGVPEAYANQVRLYARAVEKATGDRVKEAVIYWVREDRSVTVIGSGHR